MLNECHGNRLCTSVQPMQISNACEAETQKHGENGRGQKMCTGGGLEELEEELEEGEKTAEKE